MLKRRDAEQHRICFVDIADPSYDPADNAGISFEEVGQLGPPFVCAWKPAAPLTFTVEAHSDQTSDMCSARRVWRKFMQFYLVGTSSKTSMCLPGELLQQRLHHVSSTLPWGVSPQMS